MVGWSKISFHYRVFLALLAMCWTLVATFMVFQYQREKKFRAELLNTELQMYNSRIIEDLGHGSVIDSVIGGIVAPVSGLRMTLIGVDGHVIYDDKTPLPVSNHNNRPEVMEARKQGVGYSVERTSQSDDADYFYSATLMPDGKVLRSAAPYNPSLVHFLSTDSTFLWVMLTITLIVSFAGYFVTRRISTSISRLNSFAGKAERGERIFNEWSFPHDELGNIASSIVNLYVQRDQKHQEAIMQEREKIRIKKQLTNNINHELKTPLASIQVYAEILRDHPDIPISKRNEMVQRICNSVQRLGAMLNDVASLTRMDDGRDRIVKEPVDVTAVVNEVVEARRLHTDMVIKTQMPELTVVGNRQLLESLFQNLIDNAIAYSGGSEIDIIADSKCNFVVRDNGMGVPEEHLPYIFERFYRIDKGRSRDKGGTGLGLSIVKNVVSVHGGSIKAYNDNGLRFDFNLDSGKGEQ